MFSQNNDSPGGRQEKIPAVSDTFQKRPFHVPRQEIAYLRFLLEAYDGLLFLRTLDAEAGLVEIAWPSSREAEAEKLLTALAGETGLCAVPNPPAIGESWP